MLAKVSVPFTSGPFLQLLSRSAVLSALLCFSSLYIGTLPATCLGKNGWNGGKSFSSLYIGTLPATFEMIFGRPKQARFSSLYIGTLPATLCEMGRAGRRYWFQFPLHRDPSCNLFFYELEVDNLGFSSLYIGTLPATDPVFTRHE